MSTGYEIMVSGSSVAVALSNFHSSTYNVAFLLMIENYTNSTFVADETKIAKRYVK
jgi:hypothetical protein